MAANRFDQVAVLDVRLVRRASRDHRNYAAISVALRDIHADLGYPLVLMLNVAGVFLLRKVAGIRVERFKQPVQRPGCHVLNVGVGNVVGLNLVQHFFVDAHLPISAVALAGADARWAEAAKERNKDQDHGYRENRWT